ncbi:EamA family transporter [Anaerobacillus sp. HL2]|nr:EamA family transporter [Anaerobacillus sp. HL2]
MTLSFNTGDLIVLIAVIIWALYSIIIKQSTHKFSQKLTCCYDDHWNHNITSIFLIGGFIAEKEVVWSLGSVATIGYVGIFASVIAFVSWTSAVN